MGPAHAALGFAAKRYNKDTSLGWMVLGCIFIDLWWAIFVIAGIEKAAIVPGITEAMPLDLIYLPYTHSLVGAAGWALLLAGVFFALRKKRAAAIWVSASAIVTSK